ncbi:MAG: hypothetical protein L6R39_004585 [Caloplaca ligustica]|nr:MAG: hypothetical protein L6R39_004585 [Caloplaca ligustica]
MENHSPPNKPISLGTLLIQQQKQQLLIPTPPDTPEPQDDDEEQDPDTRSPKKRQVQSDPNLPSTPTASSSATSPTHVYIIKALEGWRSRLEPKLHVPILGVFRDGNEAQDLARRWLREQWPREYEFAEERTLKAGGLMIEMRTDKVDGNIFVEVGRWDVK